MSDKFVRQEDRVILTPYEKTENDVVFELDIPADSILRTHFDLESDEGLEEFSEFLGDVIRDMVATHENSNDDDGCRNE